MTDLEKMRLMESVIYTAHDMIDFQTRKERIETIAYALEQIGLTYLKAFDFADVINNVIENHPVPRQGLIREVNQTLHSYVKAQDAQPKGAA